MKICFECSEYPPGAHGGIGTLVQLLARGMVRAGHEVRVAGLYPASCPAPDFEEDEGVKVWRLRTPASPPGWLLARARLFSLIRRWCRDGEVDLIEVQDWRGPAAGWRALPVPVISRLSGSASFFSREMGHRLAKMEFMLERSSLRRSDFICSNSRYIGQRTQAVFGLRAPDSVIYPPVEVSHIMPDLARDPRMVIFAGTLAEKKGVISLVKSWKEVRDSFPDATLHIWGKDGKAANGGSMREYLRSLVPAAIEPSLHFHGHVPLDELLPEFHKAGMAVLPSYAEGFALTPLHAMATGCPTIYSTRGSGPELIAHGDNGLLVDPDRPDQISKAILTLLRSRDLADRMGERGRRLIEQRFSLAVLRAANEEFYSRCVRDFRQSRGLQACERVHAA